VQILKKKLGSKIIFKKFKKIFCKTILLAVRRQSVKNWRTPNKELCANTQPADKGANGGASKNQI